MRHFIPLSFVALWLTLASAAGTSPQRTDVFVSGQDGYHTYRIPAIVRAPDGALLAFAEGRRTGGGDSGDIDMLMKRSTDNGATWSSATVVWDDGENTCGNPCPVVDTATGTLWLLMTHNLGHDKERAIIERSSEGSRTVWITHSTDSGRTWVAPREITRAAKDPAWTWYATGPGIGIQIQEGADAGRLVVPCVHAYDQEGGPIHGVAEYGSHVIYSDDHGQTWQLGGVIRPKSNECQVVELFDGRGTLLMNMRAYFGRSRRTQALSTDGGRTWTLPSDVRDLVEPVCQASILRWPTGPQQGLLLFSNPAHERRRIQMTVRASHDGGATWPIGIELHPGPSAYSNLIDLGDGWIGCYFENGDERPYERMSLVRFRLDRLEPAAVAR